MSAGARSADLARDRALLARDLLERVLLAIPDLPAIADRLQIKAILDAIFASLAPWADRDRPPPAPLDALEDTLGRVASLSSEIAALPDTAATREAARLAGSAEKLLRAGRTLALEWVVEQDRARVTGAARASAPEAPLVPPFLASIGVPRLHTIARDRVAPSVDLGGALGDDDAPVIDDALGDRSPEEARYEELLAWVSGHPWWESRNADPGDDLRSIARDCLEDVAIHGSLRRVAAVDPWTSAAPFEQRLLDDLDALVSLAQGGPRHDRDPGVLAQLEAYAAENSLDAGRAFARSFVLGCVGGEDTARAAILALRTSHAWTRAAQREALMLAPHPLLDDALAALLDDEDPALVTLALDVLRFRRAVPFGSVVLLLRHPDAAVVEAATRCLAVAPERAAAIRAIEPLIAADPDDRVLLAAAESLAALGSPDGLAALRSVLAAEIAGSGLASDALVDGAIRLVALAGGERDVGVLGAAVRQRPWNARHLGWFGHAGLVPLLFSLLDGAHAPDAAAALARIAGPLGDADPIADPGAALSAWEARQDDFPPDRKHRHGRPFSVVASLDELAGEATPAGDRAPCAFEVTLALAAAGASHEGPPRFEPATWVARQRAEIGVLRRLVASIDPQPSPGAWPLSWFAERRW